MRMRKSRVILRVKPEESPVITMGCGDLLLCSGLVEKKIKKVHFSSNFFGYLPRHIMGEGSIG